MKKTLKEKRNEIIIKIAAMGYSGAAIGKAFKISREMVRLILKNNTRATLSGDHKPLYKSERKFIIKLIKAGLSVDETANLLERHGTRRVYEIVREEGLTILNKAERAKIFKSDEIEALAKTGAGVLHIASLVSMVAENTTEILKQKGFTVIVGSGIKQPGE